ncbi:MAG TPA: HRDC domain-containing protein, partial [Polyangiales bacterium]
AQCRQRSIASHLGHEVQACGSCDVCATPATVHDEQAKARAEQRRTREVRAEKQAREAAVRLDERALETVVAFVDALHKPLGRRYVAQALRGSRARALLRKGVAKNPFYGALKELPEVAILDAIAALLRDGLLIPKGKKYPTVWVAGKKVRSARPASDKPKSSPLERALRNFRRSEAKRRRVKPYQVFQNRTLRELCQQRPSTLHELREVWGIGEERVEKYGARLLELCTAS